jgi:hypothetical protein
VTGRSSGIFFVPSASATWQTAATVTVTSNGNNVYVSSSGWSDLAADFVGYRILRDGTVNVTESFHDAFVMVGGQYAWNFALSGLDVGVAAGSHTYTLQMYVSDSPTFNAILDGEMAVIEINE